MISCRCVFRPIDLFVHYDGKRADDIAASRFAVRQLVAQAVSDCGKYSTLVDNGLDGFGAGET